MVAQLKPRTREITRESLGEWVQEYIDGGMEPLEASAAVSEEIKRDGLQDALLEMIGAARIIHDVWRQRNIRNRPAALIGKPRTAPVVVDEAPRAAVAPPAPRPRVVNVRMVRETLLDGRYHIGGRSIRLGDMDSGLCLKAFQQYRTSAISDEHNARYFRALAESLGDGERIEDKFDDAKLMNLYELCKPSGNTLK